MSEDSFLSYLVLGMGGFIVELISIPTLIAGAGRKSRLKLTPYFNILNLESLKVSPTIGCNQVNNTHYLAVGIYLNL